MTSKSYAHTELLPLHLDYLIIYRPIHLLYRLFFEGLNSPKDLFSREYESDFSYLNKVEQRESR